MQVNRVFFCVSLFVFALLFWSGSALAYSGGSGTTADPYKILTLADWNQLATTNADMDKSFILGTDLEIGNHDVIPVGNPLNGGFRGIFDGNGHVIMNPRIQYDNADATGLFGLVSGGRIKNLGVTGATIAHGNYYVGTLVGHLKAGQVTGCFAHGMVTGFSVVGGLIGGVMAVMQDENGGCHDKKDGLYLRNFCMYLFGECPPPICRSVACSSQTV